MIRKKVMKKFSIIACAILLSTLLFSSGQTTEPPTAPICDPAVGVNTGLPPQQIAWQNLTGANQEEHIFFIGFFDQGIELFSTFFTFKLGPYQKWGMYGFVNEDATGKKWFTRKECDDKIRTASHTSLDVTCGTTSFKGAWPDWKYTLKEPEFQAQLDVHATVKTFRAGRCYYSPDKKVFADCFIHIPQGTITGTITLDGKQRKVSGEVYSDHTYQSIPFTKQGPFYYAARVFPAPNSTPDEKLYLNFSQQSLNQSYGGGADTFAFIIRGDKALGFTRKLEMKPAEVVTDKETGYKYVQRVTIRAQGSNFTVKGVWTNDKTIEIMDVFKWLPSYIRPFAEKFWKRPVYFRFLGKFDGTLETGGQTISVSQRGTSEMNFTQ